MGRNADAIRELTQYGAADRSYGNYDRIYKVQQYLVAKKNVSPFALPAIRVTNFAGENVGIVWEDTDAPNEPLSIERIVEMLDKRLGLIAGEAIPIMYTALILKGVEIKPHTYLPGLDKITVYVPKDVYDSVTEDLSSEINVEGVMFKHFNGIYITSDVVPSSEEDSFEKIQGYNVDSVSESLKFISETYKRLGFDWLYADLDRIKLNAKKAGIK